MASGGLPAVLLSAGIFLLGAALAAIAVAAIPLLLEMRRTAQQMRQLTLALEREIPDTAATLRLTGLEMSDAIQEVSMLSMDLTGGLQASARMLQEAESGMKQGVAFVQTTASQKVLPAIRSRVSTATAKGALEQRLSANRDLQHTGPTMLQLAVATKVAAKRIRFAIGAADVMGKASAWASFLVARSSRRTPPGDYPLS